MGENTKWGGSFERRAISTSITICAHTVAAVAVCAIPRIRSFKMPIRFRLYARLSNTKGDDISVERQVNLAHDYLKAHPNLAHDCTTDDYVESKGRRSGAGEKHRPRWRDLLKDIEASSERGILWSYDLSRLTRADDLMMLLARLRQQKQEVVTHRDEIDLDTLSGRTTVRIKQLFNSYYRDDISDRKQRYFKQAQKEGWIVATTPSIGLELVGSKSDRHYIASDRGVWLWNGCAVYGRGSISPFVQSPLFHSYLSTLKRVCELIISGLSMRATALRLKQERYYWTRHDGTPVLINPSHLDADALLPILPRYGEFIGQNLVTSAIERIEARAHKAGNGGHLAPEQTPTLYRLLYCGVCGRRLVFSFHTSHGHHYRFSYYHHHSNAPCSEQRYIPRGEIEARILQAICNTLARADSLFSEIVERMNQEPVSDKPSKQERLDLIARRLENAKRHLVNELLTEEDYRKFVAELETERDLIQKEPETRRLQLSPEQARAIFHDMPGMIATLKPYQLNVALRDIIEKIIVTGDEFEIVWKEDVRGYFHLM